MHQRRDHTLGNLILVFFGLILSAGPCLGAEQRIEAQLTTAPAVPPATGRSTPAHVIVELEAKEFVGTLERADIGADELPETFLPEPERLLHDVKYRFWSFNGTVPGPMIRVRAGDTVELHLKNSRTSRYPHNIALQAVNGPGGGAFISLIAPGQSAVFSFKAMSSGLYMYHCASSIPGIPAHVANGMYGLILVEPPKGLSKVDREYFVVQSEFFIKPTQIEGEFELYIEKGMAGRPDYVVFNGEKWALTGERALTANVGETVRLYFGNMGPSQTSSFHILGEVFDRVYVNGTVHRNVATILVPVGGTAIAEFKVDVPGQALLIDNAIFNVAKGAVGVLSIKGSEQPAIFKSISKP